MACFGNTAEKLQSEQTLVQAVMNAGASHKKERGEAREATKVRDRACKELKAWMSKFYRIARIACSGRFQWLEKMEIKE